jgi:serine/threonine-protein kinase
VKIRISVFLLWIIYLTAIAGCVPAPFSETELDTATVSPTPTPTVEINEIEPTTTPTESAPIVDESPKIGVDGMELIFIPGGEFVMGWKGADATIANGPGPTADFMEFPVTVDDFWMDKFEVTNAQYRLCVAAGSCEPTYPYNIPPQGIEYYTSTEYDQYPVAGVTWYMARDYCTWVGRRLPTEAEWERAARGTDGRKYVWGNEPYSEELANMCDKDCPTSVRGDIANPNFDDGFPGPAPVGSYPKGASPYGVMDMAGNMWEWTSTAEMPYPYDANDGRESQYDIAYNEKWPERILRGGPWNGGYAYLRASFRYRAVAIYKNMNMGFRCAYSE